MKCKSCGTIVGNDEQDRVQDCFDEPYHKLCFACAEEAFGQEEYMRQHSYDVETPYADNH